MDLAQGVGDRCPGVGDCCPAVDFYAFGEQGNYSDTADPLPDGWVEMLRASNYPDHPYYSAKTDVDPNQY